MLIGQLTLITDQEACIRAQKRTLNRRVQLMATSESKVGSVAQMAIARAKARKAAAKASTTTSKKTAVKKSNSKKSGKATKTVRTPRTELKDKKGKLVSGRDNSFVCVECGHEITGPWSYKNHLVKVHSYSRKKAGLREEK